MQLVCVKLATWKPLGAYFKGKCLLFLCAGVRWSTWHGMGKWPCDLVASAWWPIDHLITSLSSLLEIACSSCILSNVARPDLHGLLLRLQAPSKQQDILSTKPWGGSGQLGVWLCLSVSVHWKFSGVLTSSFTQGAARCRLERKGIVQWSTVRTLLCPSLQLTFWSICMGRWCSIDTIHFWCFRELMGFLCVCFGVVFLQVKILFEKNL